MGNTMDTEVWWDHVFCCVYIGFPRNIGECKHLLCNLGDHELKNPTTLNNDVS